MQIAVFPPAIYAGIHGHDPLFPPHKPGAYLLEGYWKLLRGHQRTGEVVTYGPGHIIPHVYHAPFQGIQYVQIHSFFVPTPPAKPHHVGSQMQRRPRARLPIVDDVLLIGNGAGVHRVVGDHDAAFIVYLAGKLDHGRL